MELGQSFQDLLAVRGDPHQSSASVLGVRAAADEPSLLGPVDQTDDGVQAQLQAVCQVTDRRRTARYVPSDSQEQLVLGGSDALGPGGVLGEAEEHPKGPTEPSESAVVAIAHLRGSTSCHHETGAVLGARMRWLAMRCIWLVSSMAPPAMRPPATPTITTRTRS